MKKFLYLVPLFLLFLIPNVNALNSSYWGNTSTQFLTGEFYDCPTNGGSCSTSIMTYEQIGHDESNKSYYGYSAGVEVGEGYPGVLFYTRFPEPLDSDYLYSMNIFMCSQANYYMSATGVYTGSRGNVLSKSYPVELYTNQYFGLVDRPFYRWSNPSTSFVGGWGGYCQYFSFLFKPTFSNTNGFGFSFSSVGTSYLNTNVWIVGYNFNNLGNVSGLSADDVANIVRNNTSNLATNSSVADVQNSVNQVQAEIEQANEKLDETNRELGDVNDNLSDIDNTLNNSDSSGATNSAGSFFNDFEDNDFGLSGIITAPLNTINTITSNSCSPINLTIPFVNKNMTLPCMIDIYEEHFGSFLDIYQIITFGIIAYWVCVQIYAMVKGFKNPDKDEIEVMDL